MHSVYPEVNVEIVPYSGDNTTTCLQNMFTAGDLPDVCTLTVYVSSSLTVDDSRMSYLHGSSFAEAKERLDRIIRQQAGQRRAHQILQQHAAQRGQSSLFHRYPTPHTVLSSFSGSGTPAARSFARIFLMCWVTAVSSAVPSMPKTAS